MVVVVFAGSVLQGLVTCANDRFSFPFEFAMIVVVLLFVKNYVTLPKFLNTYLQ